jgi:hypothetical protein
MERRAFGSAEAVSQHAIGFPGNRVLLSHKSPDGKEEQLGDRNIRCLASTRVTHTILAGKIGTTGRSR